MSASNSSQNPGSSAADEPVVIRQPIVIHDIPTEEEGDRSPTKTERDATFPTPPEPDESELIRKPIVISDTPTEEDDDRSPTKTERG